VVASRKRWAFKRLAYYAAYKSVFMVRRNIEKTDEAKKKATLMMQIAFEKGIRRILKMWRLNSIRSKKWEKS